MARRELYQILGVSRSASEKEINQAYRKLAKQYHPDRNQGNKQAEEKFKDISYAKDILTNKKKRKLYDEFGEKGLAEGFNPDAFRKYQRMWSQQGGRRNVSALDDLFGSQKGARKSGNWQGGFQEFFGTDLFESFFDSKGAGIPRRKGGKDIISEVSIGFMEAINGTEKEFTIGSNDNRSTTRKVRVRIPAGVKNEEKIRVKSQGFNGGDLLLKVFVGPHPIFWREQDNLHMNVPVTLKEALKGTKITVPTPDGEVSLSVPKRTVSGQKLRLKERGIKSRKGNKRGDLFAHVAIVLPDEESDEIDAAVDRIEKGYKVNPREKWGR